MTKSSTKSAAIPLRAFLITAALNFLWINISEVFRYFAFIMPMMREALPSIDNVAPMNLTVFAIWGVWDTILVFCVTGFVWIYLEQFGQSRRNATIAGTFSAIGIFVILWLGLFNMNLATIEIMVVAISLAWLEMIIAGFIVLWGIKRFKGE